MIPMVNNILIWEKELEIQNQKLQKPGCDPQWAFERMPKRRKKNRGSFLSRLFSDNGVRWQPVRDC